MAEERAKTQPVGLANAASPMDQITSVSPELAAYTEELLLNQVWNRKGLLQRDRSPITVSALIALGKVEQIPFHLNKAMDNGLTKHFFCITHC